MFQCLHSMNWMNKAASLCFWEIETRRRRGAGFRHLHTWTVIKVQQVLKPFLYRVWMWGPCPPSCVYFCPLVSLLATLMVFIVHFENTLRVTQLCLFSFRLCLSMAFALLSSTEVRSEERGMLERAGVVQSLTVGVAPIVVVISSVCTFTLHMALGYDLTAAEVFSCGNLYSLCSWPVSTLAFVGHKLIVYLCQPSGWCLAIVKRFSYQL